MIMNLRSEPKLKLEQQMKLKLEQQMKLKLPLAEPSGGPETAVVQHK